MADVWIRTGQFSTPASGTTVITWAGGFTAPKGIHCWYTRNSSDATNQTDANYGHGFSDGTNHRNVWHMCRQGASDNWRDQRSGVVIEIEDPTTDGTVDVRANSVTLNTSNVTIGYSNFEAGRLINYVIFGGADCEVTVGDVGADASPVTSLSFTSDLIFFACAGTQYDATSLHAYQSFGVAAAGIQQWANHYFSGDGDLDFRASLLIADQMTGQIDVDFADWKADISAIASNGFTWNGSNADHFQFMAIDMSGIGVEVGTFTKSTGTAPVDQDLPALGFTPMAYALCSATDTGTDDQPANSLTNNAKMAYGVFDGTDQVSAIETAQHNDNTDAHSRMNSSELIEMSVDLDTNGVTSSATAQTITDATPTINWNPNSAVADVIGYWAVETQAAPSGDMAGSTSLVFSGTPVLGGNGVLAGAEALTLSGTPVLNGIGTLAGPATITFSGTPVLDGLGELLGSETLTFSNLAALLGTGELAGSEALTFSGVPVLDGRGFIVGAATLVFTHLADLTNAGTIGDLAADETLTLSHLAALTGRGELSGSETVTLSDLAALTATGELAAAETVEFTSAAALTGKGDLAGAVSVVISDLAVLAGLGSLAGSESIVFSDFALLTGTASISASESIVFSLTGLLDIAPPFEITLSTNVATSGEDTTDRLTGGFVHGGGRIQDDENPSDLVDLLEDESSEWAYVIKGTDHAIDGVQYSFRLVIDPSDELDVYGEIPKWTISQAGQMNATVTIALSTSSVLTGLGDLAGSESIEFSDLATLIGIADVAGSETLTFSQVATMIAKGDLLGTASIDISHLAVLENASEGQMNASESLVFSTAATLLARGELQAVESLVFTTVAILVNGEEGQMNAFTDISFSNLAALTGKGDLAAVEELTISVLATLFGRGQLQGVESIVFSTVAELLGKGVLQGVESIILSDNAELTGTAAAAASESIILSTAAALLAKGTLEGTESLVFSDVATLAGINPIAGSESLTISQVATIQATGSLEGAEALQFTTLADLAGLGLLSASDSIVFVDNATLNGIGELLGAASINILGAATLIDIAGAIIVLSSHQLQIAQAHGKTLYVMDYNPATLNVGTGHDKSLDVATEHSDTLDVGTKPTKPLDM